MLVFSKTKNIFSPKVYKFINLFFATQNNSIILLLEPFHSILLGKSVGETNCTLFPPSMCYIESGPSQHDVEVQTVNSYARVILDTQVDMLLDTKPKVSGCLTHKKNIY